MLDKQSSQQKQYVKAKVSNYPTRSLETYSKLRNLLDLTDSGLRRKMEADGIPPNVIGHFLAAYNNRSATQQQKSIPSPPQSAEIREANKRETAARGGGVHSKAQLFEKPQQSTTSPKKINKSELLTKHSNTTPTPVQSSPGHHIVHTTVQNNKSPPPQDESHKHPCIISASHIVKLLYVFPILKFSIGSYRFVIELYT